MFMWDFFTRKIQKKIVLYFVDYWHGKSWSTRFTNKSARTCPQGEYPEQQRQGGLKPRITLVQNPDLDHAINMSIDLWQWNVWKPDV